MAEVKTPEKEVINTKEPWHNSIMFDWLGTIVKSDWENYRKHIDKGRGKISGLIF